MGNRFMVHMLKAAAGVVVLAALTACTTTTKQDEPAPQMAAALSQPSSVAPGAMPPLTPPTVPPAFDNFNDPLPDRVFFEYDKADLNPAALAALQKQAAWLAQFPSVVLVIEGHSDERGTREYNLALAARRATAVRTYLVTQGISAARVETISYGKERPACIASDETCWQLNRRGVSIVNLEATNRRN
jgi:peptidoglycan-associated lipoprotein